MRAITSPPHRNVSQVPDGVGFYARIAVINATGEVMRGSTSTIAAFAALSFSMPVFAQFSPSPTPVAAPVTGQRTLAGGTGTVTSTGSISVTTGGNAAVVMSGTSTLNNDGTIQQTATGRAIDNTVNNSSLTINNNGTISSVNT